MRYVGSEEWKPNLESIVFSEGILLDNVLKSFFLLKLLNPRP